MSPQDEKQLLKYLLSRLQQCFGWSIGRRKALERACIGYLRWRCEKCGTPCARDQREVDHVIPRGSKPVQLAGFEAYARRTIVSEDALQVLCKPCHKPKTKTDNAKTRASKKKD